MRRLFAPLRSARGQASVELVALLPILAAVVLGLWQLALFGQASAAAGAAARRAARAHAVGADPAAAARSVLAARLRRGARVRADDEGRVAVSVEVRALVGAAHLATITRRARFAPQR